MPIPIKCACGKKLSLKDELAGKKVKCPACQKVLSVPKPKAPEESLDEPWDLDDSAEADFENEREEASAKSRTAKKSASSGATSRKGKAKGKSQDEDGQENACSQATAAWVNTAKRPSQHDSHL